MDRKPNKRVQFGYKLGLSAGSIPALSTMLSGAGIAQSSGCMVSNIFEQRLTSKEAVKAVSRVQIPLAGANGFIGGL